MLKKYRLTAIGISYMAAFNSGPVYAKPQSVQDACQDIVAANDLAKGAYIVMDSACNQANNGFTPENCTMVSRAAGFAQKMAIRELEKCKPALVRDGDSQ